MCSNPTHTLHHATLRHRVLVNGEMVASYADTRDAEDTARTMRRVRGADVTLQTVAFPRMHCD